MTNEYAETYHYVEIQSALLAKKRNHECLYLLLNTNRLLMKAHLLFAFRFIAANDEKIFAFFRLGEMKKRRTKKQEEERREKKCVHVSLRREKFII